MATLRAGFWNRDLEHYPLNSRRIWYLTLSVAATVALYYQFYILPSVAPLVLAQFHITFNNYIYLILLSNLLGGVSSLFGVVLIPENPQKLGISNLPISIVRSSSGFSRRYIVDSYR